MKKSKIATYTKE